MEKQASSNKNCSNKDTEINAHITMKDFPYPSEWNNEARMRLLLSTFHAREINPVGYDSKLVFWENIINQYCLHFGKVSFNIRELQLNFVNGERMPACLDVVLLNMQQQLQVRLRSEYEYDPLNTWSGWAINRFVKKPFNWGLQMVKSAIFTEDHGKQNLIAWIHLDTIKKFCVYLEKNVIDIHRGKIIHFNAIKLSCENKIQISEDSLELCLHTLNCQRKIGLEYKLENQCPKIHLVKIPSDSNPNITITKSDQAVYHLEVTQTKLVKDIENLEEKIKEADNKTREYVKENNKQIAKAYLRKKKLLEKNYEKRSQCLHNVEALIANIEEANHNGLVLDAYKIGSKVLQNTLDNSALKLDKIDEIMFGVKDTMEQYEDVQNAISNHNLTDSVLNDTVTDDLENELRELIGESEIETSPIIVDAGNRIQTKLPTEVIVTDEDVLKMLDELEVEDRSLSVIGTHQLLS